MLDLKFIRDNPDKVKKACEERGKPADIDGLLSLDEKRRKALKETEDIKRSKNIASDEIAKLLREKQDAKATIAGMKAISEKEKSLDEEIRVIEKDIQAALYNIPNIPHESVPVGKDASANKIVRAWGKERKLGFKPLTHIELGEYLDILDFPRAAKITGSNFPLFKGDGAKLERSLINFMLDLHTKEHGYREIFPPFLVNRASMTGTGQLPKFEEDMYRLKDEDLFLVPTAEVPLTNLHMNEILDEEILPVYYTAYTACFRREAGSYGKDTKGLMRVHQFDKVELVKFVKPGTSYDELEKLVVNAEKVLQKLDLQYRIVALSTGDLSFAAAKCYDFEAFAPGVNAWLEVSSCSNFEDFQARRASIKFRSKDTGKSEYVHTLNGSGVAMARTVIAILENYQNKDGSVTIPEVLRPYMDGKDKIVPPKK
ncbi:MAG: serine--tRNA ligase [Candidatus Omnitrophica bacterium]|nr:serine--tRNA ligase [Candidatus Omnitrophota bacterium]